MSHSRQPTGSQAATPTASTTRHRAAGATGSMQAYPLLILQPYMDQNGELRAPEEQFMSEERLNLEWDLAQTIQGKEKRFDPVHTESAIEKLNMALEAARQTGNERKQQELLRQLAIVQQQKARE